MSPVHVRQLVTLAAVFAGLMACTPRMIPDTEIPDTPDDRAIMDLIQQFRNSIEAKDADGVVKLASPRYLDSRDSISYESLKKNLQTNFERVGQVKLDVTPRRVVVEGDHARMDYIYALHYILNTADPQWRSQTDDKRMTLERENGRWRVTSGF